MPGGKGKRALVIGGSMSGLFAGLQLRKQGFDVEVYERAEGELAGRGAGIVAQPPVIAARAHHQPSGIATCRRVSRKPRAR